MKRTIALALFALVVTCLRGWANDETLVTSPHDGGTPYLVVSRGEGNSNRELGLYVSDSQGDWQRAVMGVPLTGQASKGILAHLALTIQDGRYEALSVLDKKLVLFHVQTRPNDAESYITFGRGDHTLVDVFEQEISMPDITSIDDINVAPLDASQYGQGVLVSLKLKEATPFGDGITFSFYVKSGAKKNTKIELATQPRVLDYSFHSVERLRQLEHASATGYGVLSHLLLQKISRRADNDPPALQTWRSLLSLVMKGARKPDPTVPYLDLRSGDIVQAQKVTANLALGQAHVIQVYDPLDSREGIRQVNSEEFEKEGRIPYENGEFQWWSSAGGDRQAIGVIGNTLHFFRSTDNLFVVPLRKRDANIENVTLATVEVDRQDDRLVYLFVSIRHATENDDEVDGRTPYPGKTFVFTLRETDTTFEVLNSLDLTNYHLEHAVLAARIRQSNEGIVFDDITPYYRNSQSFEQAQRKTIPFLNVSNSRRGDTPQRTYLEAVEQISIPPHSAYRVYDSHGTDIQQTGVYVHNARKDLIEYVQGEALFRSDEGGSITLAESKLELPDGDSTRKTIATKLQVIPIDGSFDKGKVNFKLIVLATFGGGQEKSPPRYSATNFSFPYSRLRGVHIQSTPLEKQHARRVTTLLTIAPSEDERDDLAEGGVIAIVHDFRQHGPDMGNLIDMSSTDRVIFEGEVAPSEVKDRLRMDAHGSLYWVCNPEVGSEAEELEYIEIAANQQFFPNSGAGRKRRFLERKDWEDNNLTNSGLRMGSSAWELHSSMSVKERYPKLLDEEKSESEKEKDKEKSKKKPKPAAFPNLMGELNRLANPSIAPTHQIFVVSPSLKDAFMREVFRAWLDAERLGENHWRQSNLELKLFGADPNRSTQDDIIDNLSYLRELSGKKRGVLFASMQHILMMQRPKSKEIDTYEMDDTTNPEGESIRPHAMCWLATEGNPTTLEQLGNELRPNVSYAIVATPAELDELKEQAKPEFASGLMNHFEINRNFQYGSWKVWPPESRLARQHVVDLQRQPVTAFERQIFPGLDNLLAEIATQGNPRHQVLLVPKELKNQIMNLIIAMWLSNRSEEKWSRQNRDLNLYQMLGNLVRNQDDVFENMTAMQIAAQTQIPVLLGDLEDIASKGTTLKAGKPAFQLRELTTNLEEPGRANPEEQPDPDPENTVSPDSDTENRNEMRDGVELETELHDPHLLYLLADEGRRTQLDAFQDAKPKQLGMLLVGTQEEWEEVKNDLQVENRVNLAARFEEKTLPVPSQQVRIELLERVFARSEISRHRYSFDPKHISSATGMSPAEERRAVLGYIVSRCELLASSNNQEVITSFLRYVKVFTHALLTDELVRHRRVIDRVFIERQFSRVFNMPLNINQLPAADPLVLLNQDDAVLQFQEAGYLGPLDLKLRLIRALLSQTHPTPGKVIPASAILMGETGTGKTELFKTICRWLKLKMYDFSRPADDNAQAIIINVGKLKPSRREKDDGKEDSSPVTSRVKAIHNESMTVDDAIAHLHNFLASPNGYRGWILFDDIHSCPDAVRAKLLTEIRSLFEAEKGMFRTVDRDGKNVEIPVRNINLFMSLNPPDDTEKIRRFRSRGDLVDLIIAALAGKDIQIERSFIERWGLVLNVATFPSEAKGPKLSLELRDSAQGGFNDSRQLVLVTPAAISTVAGEFKDENARAFLSEATPALIQVAQTTLDAETPLAIVTTRTHSDVFGGKQGTSQFEADGIGGAGIKDFVRRKMTAVSVSSSYYGKLEMLRLVLDIFRTHLFDLVIKGSRQSQGFAQEVDRQRTYLTPLLHAATMYFITRPSLPLHQLNLEGEDFGAIRTIEKQKFNQLLVEERRLYGSRPHFPIQFLEEFWKRDIIRLFTRQARFQEERTRAHVISETIEKRLLPKLRELFLHLLRLKSAEAFPKPSEWLAQLTDKDPMKELNQIGKAIAEEFLVFFQNLYGDQLTEVLTPGDKYLSPSCYDSARLYMMALDKAITRLPWGKSISFLIRGLEQASENLSIGQAIGVQHFLFKSRFSPVHPVTHEGIFQVAENAEAYDFWTTEKRNDVEREFIANCPNLLVQRRGN